MQRRDFLQRLMLTLTAGPMLGLLSARTALADPVRADPSTPTLPPALPDDIPHRLTFLSQPRSNMGTAIAGHTAMFFGGATNGSPLAAIDLFDGDTGTWSTAALSEPRVWPEPVVLGDLLLLAGGTDRSGQKSAMVDIYNGRTGAWSTALLSRPFRGYSPTDRPRLAVVGRRVVFVHADVADIFDADTGAWTAQPLAEARTSSTIATAGQTVLIAGGAIGPHEASDAVDLYDARAGTWSVAQLSAARAGMATNTTGSSAIFAGGVTASKQASHELPYGHPTNVVDYYDAATDRWTFGELTGTFSEDTWNDTYSRYTVQSTGGLAVIMSDRPGFDLYDAATGAQTSIPLPSPLRARLTRIIGGKLVTTIGRASSTVAFVIFDPVSGSRTVVPLTPVKRPARPLDDAFDWLDVQTALVERSYNWGVIRGTTLALGGGRLEQVDPPYTSTPASGVDLYDIDDDS